MTPKPLGNTKPEGFGVSKEIRLSDTKISLFKF